ncbi:MAG: glycosyltransferase 87 family protein [Xenococcaceae cyanobacterium]
MRIKEKISKNTVAIAFVLLPSFVFIYLAFLFLPKFFEWNQGDLSLYYNCSLKLLEGKLPYRDFALEYPPLALLSFVLPELLMLDRAPSFDRYILFFAIANTIFVALIGYLLWRILSLWHRQRQYIPTLLIYTLSIAIASPLLPWRYDLFPAFLTLAALFFFVRNSPNLVGIFTAIGILTKLYPLFFLPIFAIYYFVDKQYRSLISLSIGCFGTIFLIISPFLFLEPKQFFSFLNYHQMRGLQIESLFGGIIILSDVINFTDTKIIFNYGAFHLEKSSLTELVLPCLPRLFFLAFGIILINCFAKLWEERNTQGSIAFNTLVAYLAIALLAFIITNKVFSPQYLIWLLPFIPLLSIRQSLLMALIWAITIYIFPYGYHQLLKMDATLVWLLNIRNLSSLVLFIWLAIANLPIFALKKIKQFGG